MKDGGINCKETGAVDVLRRILTSVMHTRLLLFISSFELIAKWFGRWSLHTAELLWHASTLPWSSVKYNGVSHCKTSLDLFPCRLFIYILYTYSSLAISKASYRRSSHSSQSAQIGVLHKCWQLSHRTCRADYQRFISDMQSQLRIH